MLAKDICGNAAVRAARKRGNISRLAALAAGRSRKGRRDSQAEARGSHFKSRTCACRVQKFIRPHFEPQNVF